MDLLPLEEEFEEYVVESRTTNEEEKDARRYKQVKRILREAIREDGADEGEKGVMKRVLETCTCEYVLLSKTQVQFAVRSRAHKMRLFLNEQTFEEEVKRVQVFDVHNHFSSIFINVNEHFYEFNLLRNSFHRILAPPSPYYHLLRFAHSRLYFLISNSPNNYHLYCTYPIQLLMTNIPSKDIQFLSTSTRNLTFTLKQGKLWIFCRVGSSIEYEKCIIEKRDLKEPQRSEKKFGSEIFEGGEEILEYKLQDDKVTFRLMKLHNLKQLKQLEFKCPKDFPLLPGRYSTRTTLFKVISIKDIKFVVFASEEFPELSLIFVTVVNHLIRHLKFEIEVDNSREYEELTTLTVDRIANIGGRRIYIEGAYSLFTRYGGQEPNTDFSYYLKY